MYSFMYVLFRCQRKRRPDTGQELIYLSYFLLVLPTPQPYRHQTSVPTINNHFLPSLPQYLNLIPPGYD